MKKFVYLNKDFVENNISLLKNTIAIVEEEKDDFYLLSFVQFKKQIKLKKIFCTLFDPIYTGDQYEKKVCNICHRLFNTDDNFQKNQNGKNNRTVRRPSCNDCRKIIDGIGLKISEKKKWGKVKPNMEIFECPICKKRTIPGLTSKVVLDHDHDNGIARGWICDSCNTGIGRFKDNISLIDSAKKFLNSK